MDDIIQVQDKMDMKLHKTRIQAFKKPRSNTVLPSVIIDPFATDYTCNKETANEVPNPQIEENSSCSCTTTFSSTTINPETLSSVNASSIETTDILSTSNSSNSLNNSNISTISPLSDLREKRAAIFTGNIATPLSESYIISAMANGQVNPNSNSFYRDLLRFVQSAVPDLSNLLEMSSVPEETVRDYGYAAEDFIMECSWDSTKCSYEDFHQFYNRRYGNCFTFNAGLNKNPQNATRWGSVYGLRLTLNTNISQYLGLLAQDSGVRIAFHQPGTFAFPEMTGMSAPPGFLTTVALSMMKIQRLPSPYPNHCQSDYPAKYIQFLPPKTTYTQLSCQVACIQSVLFKECGCVDKLPLNGTYPQCSIRDDNAQKCWLNVVKRQYLPASDVEAIICDCTPACDEVQYITSVSQSQWPSPAYQMLKINNFLVDDPLAAFFLGKYNISGNPDRFNVKEWVPDISVENNLIRFQAYYQDLNYQSLWEQASYPIERLFTDIGGIFGDSKDQPFD